MRNGNGKRAPQPLQGQAQAPTPKVVRCAIYTRKSTEEGLGQEFNSLDAQREAAEAYVASQRHEGWTLLPDRYDDGGFTGANLDRPAMKRLQADIEAGAIDCVVVYKVDRLSRSLVDFARLMETFEKRRSYHSLQTGRRGNQPHTWRRVLDKNHNLLVKHLEYCLTMAKRS